ncbi:hypothetical protein [Streptacidiphilus sp. PAMC 29251]
MTDPRFAERGENLQSRALRENDDPEQETPEVTETEAGSDSDVAYHADHDHDHADQDDPRAPATAEAASTPLGDDVDDADDVNHVDDVDRDALGEHDQQDESDRKSSSADSAVFGGSAFGSTDTGRSTDQDFDRDTDRDTDRDADLVTAGAATSAATSAATTSAATTPAATTPAATDPNANRFFEDSVSEKLRDRWQTIQIDFVDDPRHAVEQAETLVEQVSTQLTEAISARRNELHGRWSKDGGAASAAHDNAVPTEDLRTALQEYRRVLNQLLTL